MEYAIIKFKSVLRIQLYINNLFVEPPILIFICSSVKYLFQKAIKIRF